MKQLWLEDQRRKRADFSNTWQADVCGACEHLLLDETLGHGCAKGKIGKGFPQRAELCSAYEYSEHIAGLVFSGVERRYLTKRGRNYQLF